MTPTVDMTAATTKLEPALRYLAKNPGMKVGTAADKFKLKVTEVWAWLRQFNQSRPALSDHVIDSVKSRVVTAPPVAPLKTLPKQVADVRTVAKSFARNKPEAAPMPPILKPVLIKGPGESLDGWLTGQGLQPHDVVRSYQVEITPAVAAAWLTLNQGNRNPSKAKIRRFSTAMKCGRWILNGETIKFSSTGRLLDGQSRLRAIIEAATPAVIEIRAGLDDATQQTMDVGETRKGAHMLEMLGEKYPIVVAPALRMAFMLERGMLSRKATTGGDTVMENSEVGPLLERHAGLRVSVGWCMSAGHKVASLMPPSEAAFFHYIFGVASVVKRDSFFEQLATGLGLTATSGAYHLRERLQADRAAQRRMSKHERYALIIKAWNAHYAGANLGMLVFRDGGEKPEAFPTIAGAPLEKAGAK